MENLDVSGIGKRIRHARRVKDIIQKDLCEMIKVGPDAMSKLENGHMRPSLWLLVRLSKALDLSLDFIVFGEDK